MSVAINRTGDAKLAKGVLLYGGKAQAKIVCRLLALENVSVTHIFDGKLDAPTFPSDAIFCNSAEGLSRAIEACSDFVVCIGGYNGAQRAAVFKTLQSRFSLSPRSVISPKAVIDPSAVLGDGVQIMPGAFIGVDTFIGDGTIVNSVASIDHDCRVGRAVHIMGAAAVAGDVTIEDEAGLGTNATVLPSRVIGKGAMVGAGAVITRDVEQQAIVRGVPARNAGIYRSDIDLSYFADIT